MLTEIIIEAIAHHFQVHRMQMSEKVCSRQEQKVVEAKQTAAYFLYRYTRLTYEQIGNILGYSSKQNINSARKKIKEIAAGNHEFAKTLVLLESKILRD